MKQSLFLFLLFLVNTLTAQNLTRVTYQADESNFPNPGRGFYHADDKLDPETIATYPDEGITLVLREYHIDEFRDTKIPLWYLWNIQRDLNNLRNAGLKVILRFRYTAKTSKPYNDAPLSIVLMHIKQLEPVLRQNSDVIFTFQAGFIGAWGEWYYTDYFSEMPGVISEQNWIDRRTVVDSLLEMLPPEIMVNVRTPGYKKHLLNEESYNPVTIEEAYTDLPVARISHHNDCFLASASDVGTYTDTTVQKPYLAEDTKYTVIGGETCGQSSFSHCENALKELKRFHWSYLNRDYHQGVIGDWIDEGCYPAIQKKLGYRFRLTNGDYTTSTNPGGTFNFKLNILNEGFANPANPMDAEVVLINTSNNKELVAKIPGDIRFWPIDDTIKLDLSFGLPQNMEAGNYNLFLNITDAHSVIKDNPGYSIRLANQNVWEDETGYNNLNYTLEVNNNSSGQYVGGNFFNYKNSVVTGGNSIIVDGSDSDWSDITPVYHNLNENLRTLKVWNSSDTLYLMMDGGDPNGTINWFINADNNSNTGKQSFDYKLMINGLYFVNENNNWEKVQNVVVNSSYSTDIKEIAVAIKDLSPLLLENMFKVMVTTPTGAIPENGAVLPTVYLNTIFDKPVINVKKAGNTNTVYWNRNVFSESGSTIIEKSHNGVDYVRLDIVNNNTISFLDKNLEEGTIHIYRVRYQSGNDVSEWSNGVGVNTAVGDKMYISIKLDGEEDDWNLCRPVATGLNNSKLEVVRFYNTVDTLFYSLQVDGDVIHDYQLYFNIDGNSGFEYKISNDSVFSNQAGNWILSRVNTSYSHPGFMESGLLLSDLAMDTVDYITARCVINGHDVWGNNEAFGFLKYPELEPPANFDLKVSAETPYSRIKIKWLYDNTPDAYVIERSVDDSLHFETLTETSNSTSYYLDNDVDSSHVYYYRMFLHKDVLRSAYTRIMWMRPGFAGVGNTANNTCVINVYPVPVLNSATVSIQLCAPDKVKIELLMLTGKPLQTIYSGLIYNKKNINFNVKDLPAGVYLLKIKGNNTSIVKKIVLK
jgi:hypothetical protein